jgi:uncharacterized protein YceH (UPF0502 family)
MEESIKINSPTETKAPPKKQAMNTTNLEARIAELEVENAFLKERIATLDHFAKTGRAPT